MQVMDIIELINNVFLSFIFEKCRFLYSFLLISVTI